MKFFITENTLFDYIVDYDETAIIREFLNDPYGKIEWRIIPFDSYKHALEEFVKYGKFMKFPSDKVYKWMGGIMQNIAKLNAVTLISGHDRNLWDGISGHDRNLWDGYEAYDLLEPYLYLLEDDIEYDGPQFKKDYMDNGHPKLFNVDKYKVEPKPQKLKWLDAHKILERIGNGFDSWAVLPDGSDAFSDFGLKPLEDLAVQYDENMTADEVIVLINKILDVSHQRGDLASMFIEGGARALTKISYNENKKGKKIYFSQEAKQIIKEYLIKN